MIQGTENQDIQIQPTKARQWRRPVLATLFMAGVCYISYSLFGRQLGSGFFGVA